MCNLRTLWDISEESFRSLLETHLGRRHTVLPGEDVQPVELAAPMPGDDLLPVPDRVEMRAINIDVPMASVWPWLAQMMRGAGIYGWPRLESPRCASADFLVRDIPLPRIGDRVGKHFELAAIEPPRSLVWKSIEPITVLGVTVRAMTLSYQLSPLGPARSRLLTCQRCRLDYQAERLTRQFSNLIHFLLPCSQLRSIKDRAEATAAFGTAEQALSSNGHRHQAAAFVAASESQSP